MAKTVFALILTLIISASITSPVFAATSRGLRGLKSAPVTLGGFSLTPTIGEYFFAGSEQREATQSYGLKVGYDMIGKSFAENLGVEGTVNYFTTKSKTNATDATGYLFRLDVIYPFILGEKWMPFIAVGVGRIVTEADKNPLFNYGAGLKYFLEDYLAVRVDARQIFVYDNTNTRNNFEVGVGMSYYFGKERKKKSVPPPAIKQKPAVKSETPVVPPSPPLFPSIALAPLLALESVTNPFVQAAAKESAGEKSVAREGSAPKVEAVFKPVSPDKGAAAVYKLEADNQSASAKAEEPVRQANGEKVVRKLLVNFDLDSSYVKPRYSKKLMGIADILKSSADTSATIEGHTDSTGKLNYNIKLSEQRARSVQSSLLKFGVDPDLLSTAFYGPLRPVGDNATIEGRRKNRRVETLVTLIEREPKTNAEQELPARTILEAERSENERLQAEKRAKARIKAVIVLQEGRTPVSAGGNGSLPIEISNTGKNSEEFLLTITADKEFGAILVGANKPGENITRLRLAAGETFTGAVVFRMPSEMADGHRSVMKFKAASAEFSDVSFQKETVVISAAPFLRAIAKLAKRKVTPGEKLRYNVTVLNTGSLPAQKMTVRLQLPPQIVFMGAPEGSFKQEPNGTLVFKIDQVETGKLAVINLDVKVREDSAVGQELRGHVEVVYGDMQRKDIFTASASVVVQPAPETNAEQELPASTILEAERSENERLQAEKRAKARINAVVMLQEGREPVSAGGNGSLPIEISNTGKNSEEFLLTITAAEEFGAILVGANKPGENITRLRLAAGETFTGAVVFRMPSEMADGHRSVMKFKAASAEFSDVSFQKETVVISAAPFLRAIAKLAKQKVTPGEKLNYNVTVLNTGSLPAQKMTVRLQLPPQVIFMGAPEGSFTQEPNGTLVFNIDQVEIGKLAEINLDVKVHEDSVVGQELRGHVEVVCGSTQRKDIFTASASVVQAKK